MPLPTHLQLLLTQSQPELVRLDPDDVLQLAAYVAHPDRFIYWPQRLIDERRRGISTHRDEMNRHNEFHRYLRRVLEYNYSLAGISGGSSTKKTRGRPVDTNVKDDQRVYDAWQSKKHKSLADLATAMGRTEAEVKLAPRPPSQATEGVGIIPSRNSTFFPFQHTPRIAAAHAAPQIRATE